MKATKIPVVSLWIHQVRSEEHTSELQVTSGYLVCRLLLEKTGTPGRTRTGTGRENARRRDSDLHAATAPTVPRPDTSTAVNSASFSPPYYFLISRNRQNRGIPFLTQNRCQSR